MVIEPLSRRIRGDGQEREQLIKLLSSTLKREPGALIREQWRSLFHERVQQIVGKKMCPDFLANHLGCFGCEHFHLQSCFEMTQVNFSRLPLKSQLLSFNQKQRLRSLVTPKVPMSSNLRNKAT
jgi:hypothetical protein